MTDYRNVAAWCEDQSGHSTQTVCVGDVRHKCLTEEVELAMALARQAIKEMS